MIVETSVNLHYPRSLAVTTSPLHLELLSSRMEVILDEGMPTPNMSINMYDMDIWDITSSEPEFHNMTKYCM